MRLLKIQKGSLAKSFTSAPSAARFFSQTSPVSQRDEIPEDLNIFPLHYKGQPLTQRLSLIRMKDRYLSHYSKFFLELLSQYFNGVEQVHMGRRAP